MNKISSWIYAHIDELTSTKSLVLLFSIVLNILMIVGCHHLMYRQDVARQYINELEDYIGDELMDTVGSGDAYAEYHKY